MTWREGDPPWQCEGCGEMNSDEPTYEENHPGFGEMVSLWFCDQCTTKGKIYQ